MVRSLIRRWWPLAAVAVLLVLAAVAASHSSLRVTEPGRRPAHVDRRPLLPTHEANPPPPKSFGFQVSVPDWLAIAAIAFCSLAVLLLIGAGLWMILRDALRDRSGRTWPRRRRKDPSRTPPETTKEVVAALDAGLVDLSDTDTDPRRAVIACWVRLEQTAESAGVPRQVGDTPTDLVTRLLSAGRPVSADVLASFADVYREARYATHTVDERMRQQARDALQRLRAELTAEVTHDIG